MGKEYNINCRHGQLKLLRVGAYDTCMSLGVLQHSQVMAIFNFHLFLIIGLFDKNFKHGIKKLKKFIKL